MGDSISASDFKSIMDKLFSDLSSIKDKMATMKGEQSRLTVAVNRLQTATIDVDAAVGGKNKEIVGAIPPLPPAQPSHKLRFPVYDGSVDPVGWLHKAEQFFRAHGTLECEKVWLASFYMEAGAQDWYYHLEQNSGVPTWAQFVDRVQRRFGPPIRTNALGALMQLRRTGTVDEYQAQFLPLLARCKNVSEQQQIDIYASHETNKSTEKCKKMGTTQLSLKK